MLLAISIAFTLFGVLTSLVSSRRLQKSPSFVEVLEGIQFTGYCITALGFVALYGVASGKIVLPLG